MKKWFSQILVAAILAASIPVSAHAEVAVGSLPAFPGAEGGGEYADRRARSSGI